MHIVSKLLKNRFIRLPVAVMLLGLPAFSANALQVFACEPEWGALAQTLAPDADVYSATTAHQDPHHIEARPSLVAKIRRADLLVCAGAELELGWLPLLLRQAGNPRVQPGQPGHLMAAEQVSRLDVLETVDRSMGDVHASGNPHVQTDPRRLLQVAVALKDRLQLLDAANSAAYEQRYDGFVQRWAKAIKSWELQAAPLKGQYYLSYHRDISYFADWLGLKRLATLEPKPGVPPSARHLQQLRQQLSEQSVLAVLHTPAQYSKSLERFADSMQRPLLRFPLSPEATNEASLRAMFDDNIAQLLAVLDESSAEGQ